MVIRNILERIPFFLIAIPVFFLVHNNNYYFALIDWSLLVSNIITNLVSSIVLYFALVWLMGSRQKAGVLSFFLLLVFYFFQAFHEFITSFSFLAFLGRYSVLLSLLFITFVSLIFYLKKKKNSFNRFYRLANVVMIMLIVYEIVTFFIYKSIDKKSENDLGDRSKTLFNSIESCNSCLKPDIYFLLFDEYANSATLRREFTFSNQQVIEYLKSKGFYVVENSKSNYNFTHMSLASELNLDYLKHLNTDKTFYTREFLQANYTIYKNELCRILKKQGYEINNYSIFNIEDSPVQTTPFLKELHFRSVFGQTLFRKIWRDIGWNLTIRLKPPSSLNKKEKKAMRDDLQRLRETVNGVIQTSKRKDNKPFFTYAHFLFPHAPYYFDSTGKRLNELYSFNAIDNAKDYLNQVTYTNKFIIKPLVDSIFKNASRPFLILIQGDHGYRNYPPEKIMLEMENFSAFYFFDKNYAQLYPGISSVNTFRVILNNYFKQHLPLLKDSSINLMKHYVTRSNPRDFK